MTTPAWADSEAIIIAKIAIARYEEWRAKGRPIHALRFLCDAKREIAKAIAALKAQERAKP
jgi:Tfp pilus assembly major pilin PilA